MSTNNERTCLVLGAGASYPYHFPLGSQLLDQVRKASVPDSRRRRNSSFEGVTLIKWWSEAGFNETITRQFRRDLQEARSVQTIDRFLELRPDYRDIGTFSIAALINYYERQCDYRGLQGGDVYGALFRYLFPNPPRLRDDVGIITFNYDYSLETYIYLQLRSLVRDLGELEAWQTVRNLNIIHVHGELGRYERGTRFSVNEIRNKAIKIKVLHETNLDNDDIRQHLDRIKGVIDRSHRIIFLGFGYDLDNLRLLDIRNDWAPNTHGRFFNIPLGHNGRGTDKVVYGTCKGIKPAQLAEIRNILPVRCEIDVNYGELDCYAYLENTRLLYQLNNVTVRN